MKPKPATVHVTTSQYRKFLTEYPYGCSSFTLIVEPRNLRPNLGKEIETNSFPIRRVKAALKNERRTIQRLEELVLLEKLGAHIPFEAIFDFEDKGHAETQVEAIKQEADAGSNQVDEPAWLKTLHLIALELQSPKSEVGALCLPVARPTESFVAEARISARYVAQVGGDFEVNRYPATVVTEREKAIYRLALLRHLDRVVEYDPELARTDTIPEEKSS